MTGKPTGTASQRVMALGGLPHAGPTIRHIMDTPADSTRLYASGGDPQLDLSGRSNRLYASRDGGASWDILRLPEDGVVAMAVSPAQAEHLLIARWTPVELRKGVLILSQSTDGGATWTELTRYADAELAAFTRILFSPSDANIAYLWLPLRILRFDLRSRTLTEIHNDSVHGVAVDPAHADRLYVAAPKELLASEDGGRTWTHKAFPLGLDCPMALAIDPGNGARLLTVFKHMFLSEDGGVSWKDLGQVGKSYIDIIAVDPANPRRFYAYDRRTGLTISANVGRTWIPTEDKVLEAYARHIRCLHVSAVTPGLVIIGTDDGLYRSTDGGSSFAAVHHGLDAHSHVVGLVAARSNPRHVLARTTTRIYHSDDAGHTWAQSGGLRSCIDLTHNSLACDAGGSICFAANVDGDFYRSSTRGLQFEPLSRAPQFWSVVADPITPGKLYGAYPGVQVSEDAGQTWHVIPGVPNWVWALAISPVAPKVVYASDAKTVYYLETDAASGKLRFIAAKTPPDGIVREIAPDPRNPKRALAATNYYEGLWVTEDGGQIWLRLCAGCFMHPFLRASDPEAVYVTTDQGFSVWRKGQLTLLDETLRVLAHVELPDGMLLGTTTGLHKWVDV